MMEKQKKKKKKKKKKSDKKNREKGIEGKSEIGMERAKSKCKNLNGK